MEHSFDIEIAVEYGVLEAILLKHLYFWIKKNEANEKNKHDGYYWTYNSMKAFGELFPYVSERKIRNALKHLETEGLLITGNYNKSAYDRTMWYALTEKGFSILQKRKMENTKKSNQNVENVKPIPDINTDKEPDKEPYIYIQDAEKQTSESKNSAPKVSTNNSEVSINGSEVSINGLGGYKQKVKENNTSNNNKHNNKHNNSVSEDVTEIIDYLNMRLGTRYRSTTKVTKDAIKARLNEHFTVQDFKDVIDKKCIEWANDEKMAKYLRPQTLFGNKFEAYLNEPVVKQSTGNKFLDALQKGEFRE